MKKIIGVVALAMLLAAPAFGQTTAKLEYFLQIGGNNNAAAYENCLQTLFTPGSEADDTAPKTKDLDPTVPITWSVRVKASGQYDPDDVGGPIAPTDIWGVANVVWDLALQKTTDGGVTWTDVGPGFGKGDSTIAGAGHSDIAGFFSTIKDGDNDGDTGCNVTDELKAAAFAFAWGQADIPHGGGESSSPSPGTIVDSSQNNGPHLSRSQFPSTLGFPGASTATTGTLMGMGAGYEQFTSNQALNPSGAERAGVGLDSTSAVACKLGDKVIAEGQINLKDLADGEYRLHLTPGKGNNFLRGDTGACEEELTGNFAVAFPTANVVQDDIQFNIKSAVVCTTLAVATSGTPLVCRRTYTGIGDFDLALNYGLPGSGVVATVDDHQGGSPKLIVTFNQNVSSTVIPSASATNGVVGTPIPASPAANQVTIPITSATDQQTLSVDLSGVACSNNVVMSATFTLKMALCYCDVNQTGAVNSTDVSQVKLRSGLTTDATNYKFDVNCSGGVNSTDVSNVKLRSGVSAVTPGTY